MKTQSINGRVSKVTRDQQAPNSAGLPKAFMGRFPDVLAARDLQLLVERIVTAHRNKKPVIFTMGAHPIKCGLTPILIDLMRKGVLTGLATNGASIVHDLEMSVFGQTSEDVIPSLRAGNFGVTKETHEMFRKALTHEKPGGLGFAIGDYILSNHWGLHHTSLFACAVYHDIPITVHVSLGADVLHMDPDLDAPMLGTRSMHDFWKFQRLVQTAASGGVLVNWGSAVMMPEVILKAIGSLRNSGVEFTDFTMADFDMIRQYRSQSRIIDAANALGGTGLSLTGHHEIMMPLVAGLVLGQLED